MSVLDELRARVFGVDLAAPIAVPPPALPSDLAHVDHGCLICGVGGVHVAPDRVLYRTVEREEPNGFARASLGAEPVDTDVAEPASVIATRRGGLRELSRRLGLWRQLVVEPRYLGAPPLAPRIRGWTCPACSDLRGRYALGGDLLLARLREVAPDGAIPGSAELADLRGVTFAARVLRARLELVAEPAGEDPGAPFAWVPWDDVRVGEPEPYGPDVEVTRLDAGQRPPELRLDR